MSRNWHQKIGSENLSGLDRSLVRLFELWNHSPTAIRCHLTTSISWPIVSGDTSPIGPVAYLPMSGVCLRRYRQNPAHNQQRPNGPTAQQQKLSSFVRSLINKKP